MTPEGVDLSFARPGGKAIAAAGKRFVVRYVPYPGDNGKGLTRAEIADYHAHGLAIALVFESGAQRARHGRPAGVADAKTARAAIRALGMPATQPVYFAVDWDATPDEQGAIDAYLRGAASVLGAGRVGVYGGYRLIRRCKASGTAAWLWQTYAWSYQKVSSGIHLFQYSNTHRINGGAVDYVRAMKPSYGQWEPPLPDTSTGGGEVLTIVSEDALEITIPAGAKLFGLDGSALRDVTEEYRRAALYKVKVPGKTVTYFVTRLPLDGKPSLVLVRTSAVTTHAPTLPKDTTPFSQADVDKARRDGFAAGAAKELEFIAAKAGTRIRGIGVVTP